MCEVLKTTDLSFKQDPGRVCRTGTETNQLGQFPVGEACLENSRVQTEGKDFCND